MSFQPHSPDSSTRQAWVPRWYSGWRLPATEVSPPFTGRASRVLPLIASGLFKQIDAIRVQELLDYTTYPSADMLFDIMGFGCPPEAAVPLADATLASGPFRAPIMLVAAGLGASREEGGDTRTGAGADRDGDMAAGTVKKGTGAAQRGGGAGISDGR